MTPGYKIEQVRKEWFEKPGILKAVVINNYPLLNEVVMYGWIENVIGVVSEHTTAIFRIKPKVECDNCGIPTKDASNDEGYIYCEKCQDNINEAAYEHSLIDQF